MGKREEREGPAQDGRPVEVRQGEEPDDSDQMTGGDIPDEETVESVGY